MRKFSREELTVAAESMIAQMVNDGLSMEQAPILVMQIAECVAQIISQEDRIWEMVPESATPEQLIVVVYLMNVDRVNGTNYVERLLNGTLTEEVFGQKAFTGTKAVGDWSLDDVVDFQA